MSHLTQMAGLAFHNFVSAAAGAAVAVALIRGLVRRRTNTLGNFWVDLVRTCTRVLLPFAFIGALFLVSQGVIQNFNASKTVTTVAGQEQTIPWWADRQPGSDQGDRRERRRSVQRQLRSPVREPQPDHEHLPDLGAARPPVRPHVHVRQDGQGPEAGLGGVRHDVRAVAGNDADRHAARGAGQSEAHCGRRDPISHGRSGGRQHGRQGGPLRARSQRPLRIVDHRHVDRRSEQPARQLHAARRRGAARQHDVRRGQSRAGPAQACTACWCSHCWRCSSPGLMVGRTPEYLGKKIQAAGDEARRALHPLRAARDPDVHRDLDGVGLRAVVARPTTAPTDSPRSRTCSPHKRTTTARRSAASPAIPSGTTSPARSACSSAGSS